MDFLPHDGSYFDDLRADDDRHEASKRKKRAIAGVDDDLLGFFQNVRSRPWATVYVKNQMWLMGFSGSSKRGTHMG